MSTDKVDYWLKIADYDLETARAMLNSGRYLYVGFMCHQTKESSTLLLNKTEELLCWIKKQL